MLHCKKLTRLLFDFGVVNTMDDYCEQQVPSVALRLPQLTTPAAGQRSCFVYNKTGFAAQRCYVHKTCFRENRKDTKVVCPIMWKYDNCAFDTGTYCDY